jgi:Zn-dependent peptidase ImmA (M78 family)
MINIEAISKEVRKIKNKYDETDPVKLCQEMKIKLIYQPMGLYTGACKGFYLVQSRIQSITINSDLGELMQKLVLFHEIGHAVLHRKLAGVKAFHDFQLFDETSIYEYEANVFASDYLLPDEDVLEALSEDISFFDLAKKLYVPPELLGFKFCILKQKGYTVIEPPINARADFFRKY